jgi:hypothetical protein
MAALERGDVLGGGGGEGDTVGAAGVESDMTAADLVQRDLVGDHDLGVWPLLEDQSMEMVEEPPMGRVQGLDVPAHLGGQ